LIGTVDPPQAQTFETVFDDSLPGVGFQAIVLDNLITGRTLNYRSAGITIIIAVLLLLIMSRLAAGSNKFITYAAALLIYLLAAYLFLNKYSIETNYAVFLLPWILLLLYELIFAKKAAALISEKKETP
jgi:CHASE2 domain-containing sensor protein